MVVGKVKWFNNRKGWGFAIADEINEDIFIHFSVIDGSGFRALSAGQNIKFNTTRGDRGLHAIDVTVLDDDNLLPVSLEQDD